MAAFNSHPVSVEGVGTVDLPVKRSPNSRGPQGHHVLHLTDVLYIPSCACNIVGEPILEVAPQVGFGETSKCIGSLKDANGKPIAYLTRTQGRLIPSLKISGPPIGPRLGPSRLESDSAYMLSVTWPDSERARWKAQELRAITRQSLWVGNEQRYTAAEKAWLKKHYGGEFRFLQVHQLHIHNEEDRAEGRAIMRTMRAKENDHDEDMDEEEYEDEEEEEEDDDDSLDLDNHFADYLFNEKELDWIEKNHRDSATFLWTYGLKFYDAEDCAAAQDLVKSFLSE